MTLRTVSSTCRIANGQQVIERIHSEQGSVSVWRVACCGNLEDHIYSLSKEERARCMHFRQNADRLRFAVARGALRHLLGSATGIAPTAISFCHNRFGKPELAPAHGATGIAFNVSHSGQYALVALGVASSVGVDIERIAPDIDLAGLMTLVLSEREQAQLAGYPDGMQRLAFFRRWTVKEAVFKALGSGIGAGMQTVEVDWNPDGKVVVSSPERGMRQWMMHIRVWELEMGEGYVAAMVER